MQGLRSTRRPILARLASGECSSSSEPLLLWMGCTRARNGL